MIPREAADAVDRLRRGFPVVGITGPRQSGKTTLARAACPDLPYVSLEGPDERAFATEDPRGFLARFPDGALLDEVQRVPDLLSWLQGLVDERAVMGRFILTGSQQPELMSHMAQSLAGRVGRVELLPLSGAELGREGLLGQTLDDTLYRGGYPAPFDRDVDTTTWLANYVTTYVERDVRQVLNVRDLNAFNRFVRLCAGRTGQLLNASNLANDTGVSVPTVQHWLSVLEATYLITLLHPHHGNSTTRLVKTPKLHFLDVGLAAYLIGITSPSVLATHPLRGALFESYVVGEVIKAHRNAARVADLSFVRDKLGNEVDLLVRTNRGLQPIEVKAGATFSNSWAKPATRFEERISEPLMPPMLVYGGAESYTRGPLAVFGWRDFVESMPAA